MRLSLVLMLASLGLGLAAPMRESTAAIEARQGVSARFDDVAVAPNRAGRFSNFQLLTLTMC
jgi:hypothetical protein